MSELNHSGIKGMKWGVRNYQNKDGSLTPAGKERYGSAPENVKKARAEKIKKVATFGKGWYKNIGKSGTVMKDGPATDTEGLRKPDRILDGPKTPKKPKEAIEAHADYKKAHDNKPVEEMSDAELRNKLNRINMEKQYKQLNPSKMEKGYEKTKKAVAVAGTVALATGTAITLKENFGKIAAWFK